jgi:hypothetical protein
MPESTLNPMPESTLSPSQGLWAAPVLSGPEQGAQGSTPIPEQGAQGSTPIPEQGAQGSTSIPEQGAQGSTPISDFTDLSIGEVHLPPSPPHV